MKPIKRSPSPVICTCALMAGLLISDVTSAENDDTFLREESVLAHQGTFSSELSLSYRRQTGQQNNTLIKRDTFSSSLFMRYGLSPRLETTLLMPLHWVHDSQSQNESYIGSDSNAGLGNVTLALKYQVLTENATHPDLVLELNLRSSVNDNSTPTLGSTQREYGLSAFIVRSFDPVIYFTQLGYHHIESDQISGLLYNPGPLVSYRFGAGYAFSEEVVISMQLLGSIMGRSTLGDTTLEGQHSASFQIGNTISWGNDSFIEPTISFGLTPEAPDLAIGIAFPI